MESPFGLVSSSHQPRHSTHAHRPKVNTCGFSRIHLIVRQPETNLVICYSSADRLGEFTNRISKTLYLINYLQTRCLIKSDTRRHRPRAVIKADVVNSRHHLGSSTRTSSRSRSQSPSKSLDTCALCRLCSYLFWYT
jgi:hypothetical protein